MSATRKLETVAPYAEIIEMIREAGGETGRLCYQCGKCDVVCPWNRVRDFSMRKLVREAGLGLSEIELDEIWRCTTCGTCTSSCPRGVGQIDVGVAVRRLASEYGVFPASVRATSAAEASLRSDGNPLGEERKDRAAWAEDLSIKPFSEGMEVLYFVGCYLSYDPRLKKVAIATAEILKKAGVEFGTLGTDESCCGESIRKTGAEDLFRILARENIKKFIDGGVKRILVSSPHCFETFKNEYTEFMVNFEVVHVTTYLAELIRDGRLELTVEYAKKVTWHDPCYLGRHNGIYDEPREILEALPGLDLVEMADHREAALCCGGGGGGVWRETPREERLSNLRVAQARAAGAEVLATSCPYCITNFEESRLECEDALEVRDITEVILEATQRSEETESRT